MLSKLLGFLGGIKWWIGGISAAIALLLGVWWGFNAYVDGVANEAARQARIEAVNECNTVQLEEDLRAAEERASQAEKRLRDLNAELANRRAENQELQEFIDSIPDRVSEFDDDELSDRSRQFVRILSERAAQYHDQENPDN